MKKQFISIICMLSISFVLLSETSADILDTYGFGAKGMSTGSAVCASVADGTSVFYNPAGLGKVTGFNSGLSYLRTFSSMKISDSPATAPDNDDLSFGAIELDLALNLSLLADLKKNIAFGMGLAAMDDGSVALLEDVEESTYSYVQFGAPLKRITIYTGLGMEVIEDSLWIGAGAHAMIAGNAAANLTLETGGLSTTEPTIPARQELWMKMDASLKPVLGVIYKPTEDLSFGFSYKDAIAADIDKFNANLDLKLGEFAAKIPALLAILASWSPPVYRAGISYRTGNAEIEVDLVREQWSDFNRGAVRDLNRVAPEFDDVNSYHLGMTYSKSEDLNIFAGYVFAPTPVPDQPGISNYLGSDRHIVSCGGEKKFDRPFGIIKYPVWIGVSLQEQLFKNRTFTKSDGSDYSLKGNVFSALLSVRICYDRLTLNN
ncbi:MAG: outer membrane protein transport protein [Proteobacteria bacterium]|nr:outer membrane protein transport protein [Pseudomonadota bacterium]